MSSTLQIFVPILLFFTRTHANTCTNTSNIIEHGICTNKNGVNCVAAICDEGFYDNSGTCAQCPQGHKCPYVIGNNAAVACEAGKYQGDYGQSDCKSCEAGKYTSTSGQTSCSECSAGQYQSTDGQSSCTNCNVGQFQHKTGQTSCLNCPTGRYSTVAGASLCLLCGGGVGDGTGTSNECAGRENIAISEWTLSSLALDHVFAGDSSIPAGITSWDVSDVPSMNHMFEDATWFNLDISGWDVSNVQEMDNMFNGASNFNIDLQQWNISNVNSMNHIFRGTQISGICDNNNNSFCENCASSHGIDENQMECKCGTAICNSTSGLFCDAASNQCSTKIISACVDKVVPTQCACGTTNCLRGEYCDNNQCYANTPCLNFDGRIENTGPCKCGSAMCDSQSGLFCNLAANQCDDNVITQCGTGTNVKRCKCGNNICTGISTCDDTTNCCQDSTIDACSVNMTTTTASSTGKQLTAPCTCGSQTCSTGEYCIDSTATCAKELSGDILIPCEQSINLDDCACHTSKCSASPAVVCEFGTCRDVSPRDGNFTLNNVVTSACVEGHNSDQCHCGQNTCSAGQYCFDKACYNNDKCEEINGDEKNSGSCTCGTNECTAATGLYCHSDLNNQCSEDPICPNTHGNNTIKCHCGTTVCSANEMCKKSSNTCSDDSFTEYASINDGSCLDKGYKLINTKTECQTAANNTIGVARTQSFGVRFGNWSTSRSFRYQRATPGCTGYDKITSARNVWTVYKPEFSMYVNPLNGPNPNGEGDPLAEGVSISAQTNYFKKPTTRAVPAANENKLADSVLRASGDYWYDNPQDSNSCRGSTCDAGYGLHNCPPAYQYGCSEKWFRASSSKLLFRAETTLTADGSVLKNSDGTTVYTVDCEKEPYGCHIPINAYNVIGFCKFIAPLCVGGDNSEPCICESGKCTEHTGLRCDLSTSTCSRAGTCRHQKGLSPNAKSCQCGSKVCLASRGESYCDMENSDCRTTPKCSNITGTHTNSAVCACGTTDCAAGDYCYAAENLCGTTAQCADTKGDTANQNPCKCGTLNCAANEYCSRRLNKISTDGNFYAPKIINKYRKGPLCDAADCLNQMIDKYISDCTTEGANLPESNPSSSPPSGGSGSYPPGAGTEIPTGPPGYPPSGWRL